MRIGVIGTGEISESLAQWWTEAGHQIVIGSGPSSSAVEEAAAFGDAVLFAPEWAAAHDTLDAAHGALAGKPVLDATDPGRAGVNGLGALTAWAPEAQWVKAFNTVPASVLRRRRGRDPLLAEFICTDSQAARKVATRLIQDVGFAPFFAGSAENACLTETGGPLQQQEIDVVEATAAFAEALTLTGRWKP
jgi:predicted dinucleotide-binding enzyme